jgi:hypothetical protein
MQKALTTMNVRLANAISDISGVTGMAIIRAILAGERDPRRLAKLRDRRICASEEEVARSLEGNWREDVLFELGQVVEAYDFYHRQMEACGEQLQKYMAALPDHPLAGEPVDLGGKSPARRKNDPKFDVAAELRRILGVDVTRVDGVSILTGEMLLSEVGWDLSAFPTENHFASWLLLTPRRDISGGRVIRHLKTEGRNRLANALRMAAQALSNSDSYLGARYRSLRARLAGAKAVKAMARYLACLLYRLLTKGAAYVDQGAKYYESKRKDRELASLKRKAAALGMQLLPAS